MYDAQLALANGLAATAAGATPPLDLGNGWAPNEGGQPMTRPVSIVTMDATLASTTVTPGWTFTLQESSDGTTWANCSPDVVATPPPSRVYCNGFIKLRYVRVAYRPTSSAGVAFSAFLNPLVNC